MIVPEDNADRSVLQVKTPSIYHAVDLVVEKRPFALIGYSSDVANVAPTLSVGAV